MGLADTFQQIVDSLPDDWTDLELDLRIADESRYIEAAVYLVTCNASPYSKHDWHWHLLVAHRFGHAASAPTVHGTLGLLDDAGIEGEPRCARCGWGARRSRRCGAARTRRAKSSAACARCRWVAPPDPTPRSNRRLAPGAGGGSVRGRLSSRRRSRPRGGRAGPHAGRAGSRWRWGRGPRAHCGLCCAGRARCGPPPRGRPRARGPRLA